MKEFTVSQLARMAGASVRTLHHYDAIGLLKPVTRSESKYRYYGVKELLKLQQIMLYKEMDLSLEQIANILDEPGFDTIKALEHHQVLLQGRQQRLAELLETVQKTIKQLKKKTKTMNYEDLYKGFSKEQALEYRKEAAERWGEKTIADSEQKLMKMGKQNFEALKERGDKIYRSLIPLLDVSVSDKRVQTLIKDHYEMTGQFFDVTPEIYTNLGKMYVDDERFKSFYNRYHPDLAPFLRDAIQYFTGK
jgi:DNA-binding transcriptional MerR regulator